MMAIQGEYWAMSRLTNRARYQLSIALFLGSLFFLALKPRDGPDYVAAIAAILLFASMAGMLVFRRRAHKEMSLASAAPASTERSVGFVVMAGLGWAALDALVTGQGLIDLILLAVALFYLLPRALWAWRNRPLRTTRFYKAAIVACFGIASLLLIRLDVSTAEDHARQVIDAVKAFKATRHHFPERLEELVPEFLPAIPAARWAVAAGGFRYFANGGYHLLMYVTFPPFGRTTFNFENDRWGSLD